MKKLIGLFCITLGLAAQAYAGAQCGLLINSVETSADVAFPKNSLFSRTSISNGDYNAFILVMASANGPQTLQGFVFNKSSSQVLSVAGSLRDDSSKSSLITASSKDGKNEVSLWCDYK